MFALVPWLHSLLSWLTGKELWDCHGQTCYTGVTVVPSAADFCPRTHLVFLHPPQLSGIPEPLLAALPLSGARLSHCTCGLGGFVLLFVSSA